MGCLLSILRRSKSSLKRYFPRRRPVFFDGPVYRQDFDLPDPIMDYIAKNASSAIAYRKLVQSCKYFFIKNPMVVIPCLHQCSTCLIGKEGFEKFDMEKIPTKMLWLTNKFVHICDLVQHAHGSTGPCTLKQLKSKFSRIESDGITTNDTTFTLEELVFFASRCTKSVHLDNCIVQYENGESVQLETLLAQFPLLQRLVYTCHPDGSNISTNTVKEILSNPNFSNMKTFQLVEIPDTFDVESLFEYLKTRDDFYCSLNFRSDIAADYDERLEVIIDELLSTESTSFRFPFIQFPNMHPDTNKAMIQRIEEDFKRLNIEYSIVSL